MLIHRKTNTYVCTNLHKLTYIGTHRETFTHREMFVNKQTKLQMLVHGQTALTDVSQ